MLNLFTFYALFLPAWAQTPASKETTVIVVPPSSLICTVPDEMGKQIFILAVPICVFLLTYFFLKPIICRHLLKKKNSNGHPIKPVHVPMVFVFF